ncbi:MAG TPA: serine/threonine-protein kinase [Casimicrobiaceae bacterium]|nr:serine/threonine-protein kinase [Casimicrobiaceae bacterium]
MSAPETLGKYEIRRELGRGAMGVVYEAWDPMIKRVVALKTIRADQLARDEAADIVARFRREAQAAGRLNHPNIVSIYDFAEDNGISFIAMEYVAGRELREMFAANERFSLAQAIRLMNQILDALDYSHRQGVVHRDIKPSNVFVLPDGTAKVADFGIAHVDTSSLTQGGSVMGTPGYMSPEQIQGQPVDGRSDLFSAGVILYQFLTGERPFASSAAATTMQKVLREDPLPPTTLNVQLPDAVDGVVRKALAKKPDERYQTAAEFATALRAAVGPVTGAIPVPLGVAMNEEATVLHQSSTPAAPTLVKTPVAPAAPAYAKAGSQRVAVSVVAVFAIVAIAAVAWFALGQRGEKPVVAAAPVAPSPAKPSDGKATSTAPTADPVVAAVTAPPVPFVPATAPAPEKSDPGTLVITAVGLADPSNPRYQGDSAKLADDVRADAKGQLVAKALGLLVDRDSLARNYGVLNDRLVAKSASFIGPVVKESAPKVGSDGLMSVTTEAVVNVKAMQKSLNEMTRNERINLIRASGDPRIAMRIAVHDADRPELPPRSSPIAENMLKERIRSFGFRTFGDEASGGDFLVTADAKIRRVSTRLEASGITITKYAVSAMTVKCVDRSTGEEIYFNTALPKGGGTYATEDEALRAVGGRVADDFSRDFFLQHVSVSGRRVSLSVEGITEPRIAELLTREFAGLPAVIAVRPAVGGARKWELNLAGSGSPSELVSAGVLAPLNAKLGQQCIALGATAGDEVIVSFDARCNTSEVASRLETLPPAGLYSAPPARRSAVITNPDTLRKFSL